MTQLNREQVYDQQIRPLMTKIIKICMENDIALFADFEIFTEEQPTLRCTTALGSASKPEKSIEHRIALGVIRHGDKLTVTNPEAVMSREDAEKMFGVNNRS